MTRRCFPGGAQGRGTVSLRPGQTLGEAFRWLPLLTRLRSRHWYLKEQTRPS